jgi:hypothetical protein
VRMSAHTWRNGFGSPMSYTMTLLGTSSITGVRPTERASAVIMAPSDSPPLPVENDTS